VGCRDHPETTLTAVSVLLTCYNRPGMLAEAVASVQAQTYEDWELIILDDDSDDPAQHALLLSYWNQPKIRIYKAHVPPVTRVSKVRYAVNANIGLALAAGKYVTYLPDDAYYLPGRLAAMTARLDQGCHVVYGGQQVIKDGEKGDGAGIPVEVLDDAFQAVDYASVMHTLAAGLDVGGWDEDPAHWRNADAVFWQRLTSAGYRFHPVTEFTDVCRVDAPGWRHPGKWQPEEGS
jgi:glycosyltransferase involved in cell wall biosynthesis